MAKLTFVVPPEWDGVKLEAFLKKRCGFSSRTVTRTRQRPMGFCMDGRHIRTVDAVRAGSIISVDMGEECCRTPPGEAVETVYRDRHFVVFDKPHAMPTHASLAHPDATLANAFAALEGVGGRKFRPVGRLDRDTSGLVAAALHPHAAHFWAGRIKKGYLALAGGRLEGEGTVDAPIFTDPAEARREVKEGGAAAVTRWQSLFCGGEFTLLALFPQTGRTHQLRVHMAHLGHPLLGDELYGGGTGKILRQALHCAVMRICDYFEDGAALWLASPLPCDMAAVLCPGAREAAERFFADYKEAF